MQNTMQHKHHLNYLKEFPKLLQVEKDRQTQEVEKLQEEITRQKQKVESLNQEIQKYKQYKEKYTNLINLKTADQLSPVIIPSSCNSKCVLDAFINYYETMGINSDGFGIDRKTYTAMGGATTMETTLFEIVKNYPDYHGLTKKLFFYTGIGGALAPESTVLNQLKEKYKTQKHIYVDKVETPGWRRAWLITNLTEIKWTKDDTLRLRENYKKSGFI